MASNYEELYLLKISGAGEKLWERKFASPGNHYCYGAAVIEAQDGGYVTAGYSDFSPQGFNVKVDAAGNTVWIKNNYILCEQGEGIVQTTDLGFAVSGEGYIEKFDLSGILQWQKYYQDYDTMAYTCSIITTADSGYLIAESMNETAAKYDFCAIKADASGNCVWAKTWDISGTDAGDYVYSCMQDTNGNFVLAGSSGMDVAVLKISSSGVEIWKKIYAGGLTQGGMATHVMASPDNNYVITGTTSSGGGFADYFIMEINALTGDKIW
jgi:hypothetical protein